MLCARHNIAHVLLLRDGAGTFRLPGGKLKPGETELDGLRRKLVSGVCALARGGGGGDACARSLEPSPSAPQAVWCAEPRGPRGRRYGGGALCLMC